MPTFRFQPPPTNVTPQQVHDAFFTGMSPAGSEEIAMEDLSADLDAEVEITLDAGSGPSADSA